MSPAAALQVSPPPVQLCAPALPVEFPGDVAERGEHACTLALRHAGRRPVLVRWELCGPADAPLLVVAGGISATRHVIANDCDAEAGWWQAQSDVLSRYRVLAIDWLGDGDGLDVPLDSADQADAIAVVLDALQLPELHAFVGASYGAMVGLQFAARHPQRLASLTLVASAGLGPEIDADYIDGFVQAASRRELKPVIEKLFADPSLVSRQLLDDLLRYKRIDGVTELLGALGSALFGGGVQHALPALQLQPAQLPLRVVWGEQDRVIPAAHAQAAPAGATVAVLAGAGHMVMMEKAGEVNALVCKHLAR